MPATGQLADILEGKEFERKVTAVASFAERIVALLLARSKHLNTSMLVRPRKTAALGVSGQRWGPFR